MRHQWQESTALIQTAGRRWLAFYDPVCVIAAESAKQVRTAIAEVERLTRDRGWHGVGFLAFEAAEAFGFAVRRRQAGLPLAWFGLFEPATVHRVDPPVGIGDYRLGPLYPTVDRTAFGTAFERIRDHLKAGDCYQANYTFKMTGAFHGSPRELFADLVEAQEGRYSAFLDLGDRAICSASPELFFALDGLEVRTRPMKGTAKRGRTPQEDEAFRDTLRSSPKERAENVMIVDMMRNDLGRIAELGSVQVPELFVAERYPNVWQLTSTVTARSKASFEELLGALHPSASVTGAPKVRTMELLTELESEPRGVYTGTIGHLQPDGNATFNVAIRTAVVNRRANSVEFGVGSGIVWDSSAAAEYDECLLKGSVLGRRPQRFKLLETLRWTPESSFFLLERHLRRLQASADYFGYTCSIDAARTALFEAVTGQAAPLRVRLLMARDGSVSVEHSEAIASALPLDVVLASEPVDSSDVSLFHKTTDRAIYDRARTDASGADEVILWNERGEVTEATTANVVAELDGAMLTPPISCGLLGGTFREELLARGDIQEAVLSVDRLRGASRIWLINSVHESRPARLRA